MNRALFRSRSSGGRSPGNAPSRALPSSSRSLHSLLQLADQPVVLVIRQLAECILRFDGFTIEMLARLDGNLLVRFGCADSRKTAQGFHFLLIEPREPGGV